MLRAALERQISNGMVGFNYHVWTDSLRFLLWDGKLNADFGELGPFAQNAYHWSVSALPDCLTNRDLTDHDMYNIVSVMATLNCILYLSMQGLNCNW